MTRLQKRARAADLRLRRTYGITLAEYERILAHQKGRCAICKRPRRSQSARLAVDHCHTTGLLRGLVCWHCNRAIGVFQDDVDHLISAAAYLSNPPITQVFSGARYTAPGRIGSRKRCRLLKTFIHTNPQEVTP